MTYTQLAVVAVVATALLDLLVLRTDVLRTRTFWKAYAIVLFFQLVTNGVLTGFRIVRYDGAAIVGSSTGASTPAFLGDGRIGFAPVEDLLFGFALVVQSVAWWVFWGRKLSSGKLSEREPPAPTPDPQQRGDGEAAPSRAP